MTGNSLFNAIPNFDVHLESGGRKCMWCLNPIIKTNKYHIIPVFLTAHQRYEYVMPKGVICEACNSMFSVAEGKFVDFFQERLVFFNVPKRNGSKRSPVTSPIYQYVSVSPGRISFDLNMAGITDKSAEITFGLKNNGFNSTYYQKKIAHDSNFYKRGLIHCVIAKIDLESLYCYWTEIEGDKQIYNQIISNNKHNFHKHRKSIFNFINKSSNRVVSNVLMVGQYKNKFSDWNLNHNYITVSHIDGHPVVWIRILGLLFLVNYFPNGNQGLTKKKVWQLVTEHNNKTISDMISKGKLEGVSELHLDKLTSYYF